MRFESTAAVPAGQRLHFAEMLRRGHEELLLTLSAANAVVSRRSHCRAGIRTDCTELDRELETQLLEEAQQRLVAIADAQSVMRELPELYGVCVECGTLIPTERLDAAPWTTSCGAHEHDRTRASLAIC